MALVLALGLSGCGSVALNRVFDGYSSVYADVSNRQLLLNLARMSNSHPPRFLQLGLINTSFQFGAAAGATGGASKAEGLLPGVTAGPLRLVQRAATWGANAGVTVNEQPTFAFTPLTGAQFAQGFLATVPMQVFFTMLDQGEPIDQLLRVLVQSIDFTHPETNTTTTLVNAPSETDPQPYIEFLRVAGLLAELQKRRLLRAETTTATAAAPAPLFEAPTIDQTLRLAEKGFALKQVEPGKYAIATTTTTTALRVAPEARTVIEQLSELPYYKIDVYGFMTLRLRSFFAVMSWVSLEQRVFDTLAAQPGFLDKLPPSQRRPVLRLRWDTVTATDVEPPVVALEYGGEVYAITDVRGQLWNRDVFTLLSYIESQVALDPKNLPVQQLIQIR